MRKDFFVFLIVMLILTPFMKIGFDRLNKTWATATRESGSIDAVPMSLYGNYNGTVKRVAVDSTGNMVVSGTSTGSLSLNTITTNTVTANTGTFSDGITAGGTLDRLTFSTYGSYIDASAGPGKIILSAANGNNNESIQFDGESIDNYIKLTSPSGALYLNFPINFRPIIDTDGGIIFGSTSRAKIVQVSNGNDSFQIGVGCNSVTSSGYVSLLEVSSANTANRSPLSLTTHPTFRIYAEGNANALDYGSFYHDTGNFNINCGHGDIIISPQSNVAINGNGTKIKIKSPDGTVWSCGVANTTGEFSCN